MLQAVCTNSCHVQNLSTLHTAQARDEGSSPPFVAREPYSTHPSSIDAQTLLRKHSPHSVGGVQHVLMVRSTDDPNVYLVNDTADPLQRSLTCLALTDVLLGAPPPGSSSTFAPASGAALLTPQPPAQDSGNAGACSGFRVWDVRALPDFWDACLGVLRRRGRRNRRGRGCPADVLLGAGWLGLLHLCCRSRACLQPSASHQVQVQGSAPDDLGLTGSLQYRP